MKVFTPIALLPLAFSVCRCPEPHSSADATVTISEATAPASVVPAPPPPPLNQGDQGSGGWNVRITEEAAFEVELDRAPAVESAYLFFGPQWSWGGARARAVGDDDRSFVLSSKLPVVTRVTATPHDTSNLKFRYVFDVQEPLQDISGLGLELRVDAGLPEAVLHEDGKGVTIPSPTQGDAIEVRLEAPRGRIYFERGNPRRIRLVFVAGNVPKGPYETTLEIRLPRGGQVAPSTRARYGTENPDSWIRNALVWNDWPVDVSFLNTTERPAGKRGKLRVAGDALVFADGTPARFWGANLSAYALFSGTDDDVALQAQRIAALGFNLVRIHHHDSHWQPTNVFAAAPQSTEQLDENALRRLDWWIKCLEELGVYIWIDIHVGRQFRTSDKIAEQEELERTQKGQAKGFNYVNPRIEALMADFAARYMKRENHYTKKKWTEDPGIVTVLITNENDLADHFGNYFTPDKKLTRHQALFETQARAIASERGLPLRQALRVWEPGPAKILLAELQHRFDARALDQLERLGVDVPIATTNYWGRNSLWSLPPLLAGDVIDAHSYGEAEALSLNPHRRSTWVHFIAGAAVAGKPLTVSEWNVPSGHRDRFTAAPYIAAIGALQGWDSLILYCYSQDRLQEPKKSSEFSAWVDPSMLAMLPTTALMYRRGDIEPARQTFTLALSEADVFETKRNAETSAAIRTLAEQHRLVVTLPKVPALPWLESPPAPPNSTVVTDLDRDFLPDDGVEVVSDTAQIRRNWAAGVQTIDTPATQIVSGWIGAHDLKTHDVTFAIQTPKATVSVTSLDGQPIARSQRLLLTAIGRSVPDPKQPGWRSEPVRGSIALRRATPLRITPLGPNARGRGLGPSTSTRTAGADQVVELGQPTTHWFLLEGSSAPASTP